MGETISLGESRLGFLSVADLAGLVDLFTGEAEVGRCGFNVPFWNLEFSSAAMSGHLSPFPRCVVLIGEAFLGFDLDLQGVGLKMADNVNQFIMGALRQSGLSLR